MSSLLRRGSGKGVKCWGGRVEGGVLKARRFVRVLVLNFLRRRHRNEAGASKLALRMRHFYQLHSHNTCTIDSNVHDREPYLLQHRVHLYIRRLHHKILKETYTADFQTSLQLSMPVIIIISCLGV